MVSTIYAYKASFTIQPLMQEHGLDFDVTTDGTLLVRTLPDAEGRSVSPHSKVVALNGRQVSPHLVIADLAAQLGAARGQPLSIALQQPDGRVATIPLSRQPQPVSAASERARELRIWARLGTALLACSALLVCSLLLALRRPHDPVAMLLAFGFTILVGTIDPPLQYWLWTDQDVVIDVVGGIAMYLLLIGLAAFPDGAFVPRFLRWLIPLGILLAFFSSIPDIDEDVQGVVGILALLAVLVSQFIRLRRQPTGIERQQLKWAAFGFGIGLLLIFAAVVLAAMQGDDPTTYSVLISTIILLLFNIGLAIMALGLLVALIRFRLWEADTVITRSAAYAVVTVIVGIVWAASSDLVKLVITEVMGRESEAGATTVGAIIAAGVFSPTQSAVLGWTRRHFGSPLERIKGSAERLKSWGLTEAPAEVATRALGIIDEAVHPLAAAVLLDTADGEQTIARRGQESALRHRMVERVDLSDEEGSVGALLLGRRSDGNRYNRQELEAVRELVPHIADALRVAQGRHSRESMLQQQIEAMAARLSQLEGGSPKPA